MGEDNAIGPDPKAICKYIRDILNLVISQSCVLGSQGSSSMVDQLFKFEGGPSTSSEGAESPVLDAFFKGWDAQLWHHTASGLWHHEELRLHINRVSCFRIIRKSDSDSKSVDFHRQFISGFLSEQAERCPLSGMCALT